jgi:hypothetical protein
VDLPVTKDDYLNNAYFHTEEPGSPGAITLGAGGLSSSTVLAHEAGHALNEQTPGLTRFLQRNVYGFSPLTGAIAPAAGLAVGASLKSPWKGGLAGAGLGALINAGYLVPEGMASYHALDKTDNGKGGHHWGVDPGSLGAAFMTYLAAGVAPSAIAGLLGGWAGQRHQQGKAQAKSRREALREGIRDKPMFNPELPRHA